MERKKNTPANTLKIFEKLIRVENLEWATASENSTHAYKTGLRIAHPVNGSLHYAAKLNDNKVLEIRKSNLSQKKLSVIYGVSAGVIQRIKERKSWKHV